MRDVVLMRALVFAFASVFLANYAFADLLVQESFETDGEGVRYTSNAFDLSPGSADYFTRTTNPHPEQADPTIASGIDGSFFWASEDIDGGLAGDAIVRLNDLSVSNVSNAANDITVTVGLAVTASQGSRFEDANSGHQDEFRIEYAFDGNSGGTNLAAGNYLSVARFAGTETFGGLLREDADLDGFADPAGTAVTNAMTDFSYTIPKLGDTLSIQIVVDTNGSTEEISFDNIRINATVVPEPSSFLFLGLACCGALAYRCRKFFFKS